MSQLKIWFVASLLLLIVSNAMWAFRLARERGPEVPSSYGCTKTEQYGEIRQELVQPIAAAVNASVMPGATKQSILAAARGMYSSAEILTCVIPSDTSIGPFGLRFDGDRLVAVSTLTCTP